MGNDVELETFPKNRSEALAMLYLEKQDLTGKTPAEIHTMYWEAKKEIMRDFDTKREEGYSFR